MELSILAVSVGQPKAIGIWQGEPVISAIAKRPVAARRVVLGRTNLEGDAQADLRVHGGADKAVYAYPARHWEWWAAKTGLVLQPGGMGENLTLDGGDETQVRIGDRFQWGPAVLEVSEPRGPCYKLATMTARPDAPALMTVSGYCGWYFRVAEPGEVPVTGAHLVRIRTVEGAPSVRETFLIRHRPKSDPALLDRCIAAPALAEGWRRSLIMARGAAG